MVPYHPLSIDRSDLNSCEQSKMLDKYLLSLQHVLFPQPAHSHCVRWSLESQCKPGLHLYSWVGVLPCSKGNLQARVGGRGFLMSSRTMLSESGFLMVGQSGVQAS